MSTAALNHYTPEEYLALERRARFRSEYIDGRIVAMSGGSAEHGRIVVALQTAIDTRLRGGLCELFPGDVRVRVHAASRDRYCYPDATIVCGEARFEDGVHDTLLNPVAIVEVLSPTTEAYDRGDKFAAYRTISSLREYVLIAQDSIRVERFRREGEFWALTVLDHVDAVLELDSVGCSIPLREIYARAHVASPGGGPPRSTSSTS